MFNIFKNALNNKNIIIYLLKNILFNINDYNIKYIIYIIYPLLIENQQKILYFVGLIILT